MKFRLFVFLTLLFGAPVWPAFGTVHEVANPVSEVDRNVRMVSVAYIPKINRVPLVSHFVTLGWVSDSDKMDDFVTHGLAADRAAELAGVRLEQFAEGIGGLFNPPLPDGEKITGRSSTAAAFAEWYLFSKGLCLDKLTVISANTAGPYEDLLYPIGSLDEKMAAAEKYGAEVFIVSDFQSPIPSTSLTVLSFYDVVDLASYLDSHSHSCSS